MQLIVLFDEIGNLYKKIKGILFLDKSTGGNVDPVKARGGLKSEEDVVYGFFSF